MSKDDHDYLKKNDFQKLQALHYLKTMTFCLIPIVDYLSRFIYFFRFLPRYQFVLRKA